MKLSTDNRLKHNNLRGHVALARDGELYPDLPYQERASYLALVFTRLGLTYGTGGRYAMESTHDEPATWSRFVKQADAPPALECAGFVEMILYVLGIIDGGIFTYRGLREVPSDTSFYSRASHGDPDYQVEWIPGEGRPKTITELNGMGAWAQTPVLLFFDRHFRALKESEPLAAGDVLNFMNHDRGGYHFHSGIWVETSAKHGLVHSSPSSRWDEEDGPKYTPVDSRYFLDFLQPQQSDFARMFGSAATRLKEQAC